MAKGENADSHGCCIRCPVYVGSELCRDFSACTLSTPVVKGQNQVTRLWRGFSDGPVPGTISLSDPTICGDLLEEAKKLDDAGKSSFVYSQVPVTKTMLEIAMTIRYPVTLLDKKQRKQQKKAAKQAPGPLGSAAANGNDDDAETTTSTAATADPLSTQMQAMDMGDQPGGDSATASTYDTLDPGNISSLIPTLASGDVSTPSNTQGHQNAPAPQRPASSKFYLSHTKKWPDQRSIGAVKPVSQTSALYDPKASFKFNEERQKSVGAKKEKAGEELYAFRKDFGTDVSSSFNVYANHFKVTLSKGKALYEYGVSSVSSEWNKATHNKRKVFMQDLIDICAEFRDNFDYIASDFRSKIIAVRDIFGDDSVRTIAVPSYRRGTRDPPIQVDLEVKLTAKWDLDKLQDYISGKNPMAPEQSAIEALNIIIAKTVTDGAQDVFQPSKANKFYFRPGWEKLGNNDRHGLVAVRGYSCSVRPSMGILTLNINMVTSAFYDTKSVQEYLDKMGPFSLRPNDVNLKTAKAHLNGLRTYLNFSRSKENADDSAIDSDKRRIKTISNVDTYATSKKVEIEDQQITVYDHLLQKYPASLAGADRKQFAVNVGGKDPLSQKFYLAGNLDVLADQLYRDKIPSELVSHMIDIARRDPQKTRSAILGEGLSSLRLHKSTPSPLLRELGLAMSKEMIMLPARAARAPDVHYGGGLKAKIDNGRWTTLGKTFYSSHQVFRGSVSDQGRVNFLHLKSATELERLRPDFRKGFLDFHAKNGIQKLNGFPIGESMTGLEDSEISTESELKAIIGKLHQDGVDLVVLFLPKKDGKNAARHALFKSVCERKIGIKNIVFCEESMRGSIKNLGAYFGNAVMKLNLRLGNINHILDKKNLSILHQTVSDCMVLGADVTHPGVGAAKGTPSIAAVVGSVDNEFIRFSGAMRYHTARQEYIENMKEMTCQALRAWARKNASRLPTRILYYRDGVGESYYNLIRDKELSAIREAWGHVKKELPGQGIMGKSNLKLTAVIVAKRHNTRFFCKEDENNTTRNGNVRPGTVVDSGITSPYFMDFYLQSHNASIGTGRPAHYFVLENGMNFTPLQLQNLTNNLCYTYQKSTNAVSYVTAAYYADRLCERGRQYLKSFFDGDPDLKELEQEEVESKVAALWNKDRNGGNPWHPNFNDKMFWL